MKTFQEFVAECYSIQETSLNRIRSKSEKGGMAILSGQRGDKSKKENKERSKRAWEKIKQDPERHQKQIDRDRERRHKKAWERLEKIKLYEPEKYQKALERNWEYKKQKAQSEKN